MELEKLKENIINCRCCQYLFQFEPRPIFFGNIHSKIVQISQAPSKKVYESGKPFHDQSGKRLREEWYQITEEEFYNPNHFYIVSLSHCYPGKNKSGKDQKPPKVCFQKWVSQELELVDNKIYLIVGSMAASKIFPNIPFEKLVFQDCFYHGKPTFVLPHPSPLNYKWLKDHPKFLKERMPTIRKMIHDIIRD